jgi:hypothetical protein
VLSERRRTAYHDAMQLRTVVNVLALVSSLAFVSAVAQAQRVAPATPLPPIPYESFQVPRPPELIKTVYEFAAYHPEVLNYVPCYCGCESVGHKSNQSCFVKSRDAQGRVTAFDSHGTGCTVCIDVARDAMQMYNAGASVKEIRAAIEMKWAPRFPSHTPTPPVPAGRAKTS